MGNHLSSASLTLETVPIIGDQLLCCRACITLPSRSANNSDKNYISHSWRKLDSLSSKYTLIEGTGFLCFVCWPRLLDTSWVLHDRTIITRTDSISGLRANSLLNSVLSSPEHKAITHHTQFGASEMAVILSSVSVLQASDWP